MRNVEEANGLKLHRVYCGVYESFEKILRLCNSIFGYKFDTLYMENAPHNLHWYAEVLNIPLSELGEHSLKIYGFKDIKLEKAEILFAYWMIAKGHLEENPNKLQYKVEICDHAYY